MTTTDTSFARSWVRIGLFSGIGALVAYTLTQVPGVPSGIGFVMACAFGPLFGIASLGMYHIIGIRRRSALLQISAAANFAAGALVTAMFLDQLSVRATLDAAARSWSADAAASGVLDLVRRPMLAGQLGLDVAWDIYASIGTFCFAWVMYRDERFGRAIGTLGMAVASLLLVLNLVSFPAPPASAGLFDVGPMIGVWYLVVTIRVAWLLARRGLATFAV